MADSEELPTGDAVEEETKPSAWDWLKNINPLTVKEGRKPYKRKKSTANFGTKHKDQNIDNIRIATDGTVGSVLNAKHEGPVKRPTERD